MSDLYNPFLGYKMTQGWTAGSHVNNPAMDYGTPVGFRFGAPAAGVYRQLPTNLSRTDTSAAGRMGELLISEGRWAGFRIRFAHLSAHIAGNGARVSRGDIIAATGNTGYVRPNPDRPGGNPWDGAHVHTYGLTPGGLRWNWTLYAGAEPADNNSKPFEPEEEDMTPEQDARLKTIEGVLAGIQNAIGDPNIGILKNASLAAGKSTDTLAVIQNVERIVAGHSNALGDPNIGILKVVNENRDLLRALKLGGSASVDVDALAARLKDTLAPEIVKALGEAILGKKAA